MGKKTQLEVRQQSEASEPPHRPSENIKSNHTMSCSVLYLFLTSFTSLSVFLFSKREKKTFRFREKSEQKNMSV